MKPVLSILLFFLLLLSCDSKKANKQIDEVNKNTTSDSLKIIGSKEYRTVIEFLKWYKQDYYRLSLSTVEMEVIRENGYARIVDTVSAKKLLNRYRLSGYLTEEYIQRDSLYIWEALVRYEKQDLEVYDAFDHDFVLHTQETVSALQAIPKVKVVAEKSDLRKGIIALQIDGCPLLFFHVKTISTQIKITDIWS